MSETVAAFAGTGKYQLGQAETRKNDVKLLRGKDIVPMHGNSRFVCKSWAVHLGQAKTRKNALEKFSR
jgi:hypothetical protein